MPQPARLLLGATIFGGLVCLAVATIGWHLDKPVEFAVFAVLTLLSALVKIRLPGISGTISVTFVFLLVGLAEFSFAPTVWVALVSGIIQTYWHVKHRPGWPQLTFNPSSVAISLAAAASIPPLLLGLFHADFLWIRLPLAACVMFFTNVLLITAMVSLIEDRPFDKVWAHGSLWALPHYIAGGLLAALVPASRQGGWEVVPLGVFGLAALVWAIYRLTGILSLPSNRRVDRPKRYTRINRSVTLKWTDRAGELRTTRATIVDVSEWGMGVECVEPISSQTVMVESTEHHLVRRADVRHSQFITSRYVIGLEFHLALSRRPLTTLLESRHLRVAPAPPKPRPAVPPPTTPARVPNTEPAHLPAAVVGRAQPASVLPGAATDVQRRSPAAALSRSGQRPALLPRSPS